MRIANIILTVLFLIFAIVQYNDPDPLIWMLYYSGIAVISAFAVTKKYNLPILTVTMLFSLGGAIYLSPGVYDWFANHNTDEIFEKMAPNKIFIEEARECFGLLIGFFVLLFHFIQAKKEKA